MIPFSAAHTLSPVRKNGYQNFIVFKASMSYLKITASQRKMSDQNWHLFGKTPAKAGPY